MTHLAQPVRKKILLAEDDDDDSLLFRDALGEMDADADLNRVKDGEELMNFLNGKKDILPDLLFLDINMPRKNGFECLTEIKNNHSFKNIPVIVFSTSSGREIVRRMFDSGADLYVCKPNRFSVLKKIIQRVLSFGCPDDFRKLPFEKFVLNEK